MCEVCEAEGICGFEMAMCAFWGYMDFNRHAGDSARSDETLLGLYPLQRDGQPFSSAPLPAHMRLGIHR